MKYAAAMFTGLLGGLLVCRLAPGQQPAPPACPTGTPGQACGSPGASPHGLRWTDCCFPRHGCPDDYCPHPYPRPCPLPYPPFYRCVPAGNCHPTYSGPHTGGLAWWFVPTPRALREAIWCQP